MEEAVKLKGLSLGLPNALIQALIQKAGPVVAQTFVDWFHDLLHPNMALKAAPGGDTGGVLKSLLIGLLTQYKEAVLALADEELHKGLDFIIGKLSS